MGSVKKGEARFVVGSLIFTDLQKMRQGGLKSKSVKHLSFSASVSNVLHFPGLKSPLNRGFHALI